MCPGPNPRLGLAAIGLSLVGGCGLLLDPSPSDPGPTIAAWPEGYGYRWILRIPAGSVSADLAGFPVLVQLTDRPVLSSAQPGASDLFFVDAPTGRVLAHEVDTFDPDSDTLLAWVRIPLLRSDADTDMVAYIGGPGPPVPIDACEVWSEGYALVAHAAPGSVFLNSDDPGRGGIPQDVAATPGPIGAAVQLAVDGAAVRFDGLRGVLGGRSSYSVSMWMRADAATDADWQRVEGLVFEQGDALTLGRTFRPDGFAPSEGVMQVDVHFASGMTDFLQAAVLRQRWHHVAFQYDGRVSASFADGRRDWSSPFPGEALASTDSPFFIGGASLSERSSSVDEVRLATVARADAWFLAEAVNQTDPLGFVQVVELQVRP